MEPEEDPGLNLSNPITGPREIGDHIWKGWLVRLSPTKTWTTRKEPVEGKRKYSYLQVVQMLVKNTERTKV